MLNKVPDLSTITTLHYSVLNTRNQNSVDTPMWGARDGEIHKRRKYSKVSIIRPVCSRLLEFEKNIVLVV